MLTFVSLGSLFLYRSGLDCLVLLAVAYVAVVAVVVVMLLGYHLQLVAMNLTTNEHHNFWRYEYFKVRGVLVMVVLVMMMRMMVTLIMVMMMMMRMIMVMMMMMITIMMVMMMLTLNPPPGRDGPCAEPVRQGLFAQRGQPPLRHRRRPRSRRGTAPQHRLNPLSQRGLAREVGVSSRDRGVRHRRRPRPRRGSGFSTPSRGGWGFSTEEGGYTKRGENSTCRPCSAAGFSGRAGGLPERGDSPTC
jgi:hypothetical protein